MKLQFSSTLVNLSDKQYNVLTLAEEIKVYVCISDIGYLILYGDIPGLNVVAYCFTHAALNPNRILFLPLRQNDLTDYLKEKDGIQAARDLVILNHKLQFNYKDWKTIRQSLQRQKSPSKFIRLDDMPEKLDTKPFLTYRYRENNDILNIRDYINTLFLVGSRKVFGSISSECQSLAQSEPDKFAVEYPGYHDHRHMDIYMRNRDYLFSIDFYDEKIWGR